MHTKKMHIIFLQIIKNAYKKNAYNFFTNNKKCI